MDAIDLLVFFEEPYVEHGQVLDPGGWAWGIYPDARENAHAIRDEVGNRYEAWGADVNWYWLEQRAIKAAIAKGLGDSPDDFVVELEDPSDDGDPGY